MATFTLVIRGLRLVYLPKLLNGIAGKAGPEKYDQEFPRNTDLKRYSISKAQNLHDVIEESSGPNQPQVDTLREWLVRELSQILDISQEALATNEPLSYFGLDSAQAVGLVNRLGSSIGRKLPIALVWEYPTIDALATYLGGNSGSTTRKSPAPFLQESSWNQPIAVIGLACRFPGAPGPEAFWDLLRSGKSAFREITSDRWDVDAWYDPDVGKPGKSNALQAGLLDRIDEFDPGFFSISPREAVEMDPQQRLALELTWEALEDAGVRPDVLRGSRTGVFVGAIWHDYEALARKTGAEITAYSGTGQSLGIVANRISYALGLQGPSMALDTACSSSLVSVHLACRSLQTGDATLAVAGGVNMIIDPETMVTLSKFGGLSPTNELRAFDAGANGFVRGEGGGFIVLKSLNQALADGDPIYAVIRGSAVNNDGASNGLTAPNPQAQETVLAEAYARAGIQPSDVHYVEAHGTGTRLGDPIEAHALGTVFGHERPADQPLLIGSVKTNIGHLEGAAGIAGLIKLILSVHHRQIPPSLNFETPNPHIDFAASNLRVVANLESWPKSRKPSVGGASAFGWGGTNCHVIVEEAGRSTAHLLPLSAPDPGTLKVTAEELRAYLQSKTPDVSVRDICATAARCVSGLERVALTARSVSELNDQLEGFLLGQKRPGVAVGRAAPTRPTLAFVFSPQGSQWLGMGKSLMAVEPVFRAKLAECDRVLRDIAGWSVFDELLAGPAKSRLNSTEFVQPTLSSIQIALAELWNSWGIQPDFIAGHSLGEWAAACVAGALSVEETIKVVVESSRAQAGTGADGGMAVVELAASEAKKRIDQWADEVFIAGYNSPTSTILSGDVSRLTSIVANWKEEGLTCSLIDVTVAAHSPRMDKVRDSLKNSLGGLRPTRTAIPLVSSINGDWIRGVELHSEHWAQHIREPVLFTQVIERLAANGCTIFLEIGPHPLLRSSIQQTLHNAGVDGLVLSSCRRGDDERGALLNSLGTLYVLGWPVAWPEVTRGGHNDLSLPIPTAPPQERLQMISEPPLLLPVSGRTDKALRDRARSLAKYIRSTQEVAATDIVYVAAARRQHLAHRLALVGTTREELASALETFASGQDPVDLISGCAPGSERPKVAFICSGQGTQWWGMGRELLASTPVFRQEFARCADEMKRYAAWDLQDEMARDEDSSRLGETEIAQPALFALQVALAAVWRSWGIKPDALVGHSVGEVAAAYLGGALSFADAVQVICLRGRLMQRATGMGKMAAIELPESDVEKLLSFYSDRVSLAAVNSPTSTVISGEANGINEIVATATKRGVQTIILPVNYAFHSPQMESIGIEMTGAVSGLIAKLVSIPVYSTVTGAQSTGTDFAADYWGRNIRCPVLFAAAVRAMLEDGINAFVELSPHPALSGMVNRCAATAPQSVKIRPSLRRGQPERIQMFKSLSALFAVGADVDWRGVYPRAGRVVSLPAYPWQRKRFWLDQNAPAKLDTSGVLAEATANWFYDVDWEEKSRPDDSAVQAVTWRLPTPKSLKAAVELDFVDRKTESPPGHSATARDDIENLAAHFATAALIRLGLEYSPSRRFTSAGLAEQLGVRAQHGHLFARMLEMLLEKGLLTQIGTQFETAAAFKAAPAFLASIADQAESLRQKHADFATEFELLARCGVHLAGVLRGEIDPLQLLFPSDGSVNAERLYRESFSARYYNQLLGELVANAAQTASLGHTVRLLEIGAGTGSTTHSVLERLSDIRTTYCFTDVSRLLLNEARTKFDRFPSVGYATLNIEKPLETQGFKTGAYDIVLASNVLHATADLRVALRNVRQLLAPGGLLLLCETTAPRRWLDLIFGLTEGWNRFSDTELRTNNALLGADQWLGLLNETGFHGTVAVGSAFSAGTPHEQTVLVAKVDVQPPESSKWNAKTASLSSKGRWLIFSDAEGLAEVVAQRLKQDGGETVLVEPGDHFEGGDPRRVTINFDQPEDYRRLLNHGTSWRGVLHAWSLDTALDEADPLSVLERAERLGTRSALFLIRALADIEQSQPPKLWFLTRGAQTAWLNTELGSIAQSPVWGLGRTAALEHPNFWGGLIDVAVGADPRILGQRIALEISSPDGEDQIALSEELRMVPRLLSTDPPATAPTIVRPDSSYLITGGLGGLGPRIADWLARNGARELILCSRRVLPARENWEDLSLSHHFYEQVAAIQKFEKMGIEIRVEKVDIADREQAKSMFDRIRDSQTPLRGIIHAAAEIKFCALQEMSSEALHAAMRAKVEGTWWLHKFSQNLPLDFFVLFSSTAALFGASRLGHYAAANQFLDSFARWRRAAGLPGLSVNWGTWEEVHALGENRDEPERFGLRGMPAHLALQALSFLVTEGVAQRLVADVDWELLKPAVETRGRRPFFSRIRSKPTIDPKTDPKTAEWIKRLDEADPEDRRELLSTLVARETRRILGFQAEDQLDLDRGLFELGMDSLMSVQLKGRLEKSIGGALPATLTFIYPTVHALADFLLGEVLKRSTTGKVDLDSNGNTEAPDKDLANLSEEEIKNMLSAELSSLPEDYRD